MRASGSPRNWPAFLRRLCAIENDWRGNSLDYPEGSVPFMPYPLQGFLPLLMDALMAVRLPRGQRRARLLDAGCGVGTKLMLAQALFGLDVTGIDVMPELVSAALDNGVWAEQDDVLHFTGWAGFDIIYLNRPVGDHRQQEVEDRVRDGMHPGAVLIHVNGRAHPGAHWGWRTIAEEYGEPACGVWQKPA